jgi:hypothetical protein
MSSQRSPPTIDTELPPRATREPSSGGWTELPPRATSEPSSGSLAEPACVPDEPTVVGQRRDSGLDRLRPELFAGNLKAMQDALSRCRVEHVSSSMAGFNFQVFVNNLRGMAKLEIGPARLFTLMTRNNAFLLSEALAEELPDLARGLMNLKLGDRVSLLGNGKRIFLFRVPSKQLEELRRIANNDRILTAGNFPFGDIEQFRQRVSECVCPGGAVNPAHFAASVLAVTSVYEDAEGVPHHRVTVGLPEESWLLYVDHPHPPPGAVQLVSASTTLSLIKVSAT